jgi:hypothetical protein
MSGRRGDPSKLTSVFFVRDCVMPSVKSSPAAKSILLWLATYANPDGTRIFMGSRKIAELTGYVRNTVIAAIKFWLATGILVLVKRGRRGSGHANEYRIALEKGELFTLSGQDKGSTIAPLDENKRVNPEPIKGQSAPMERVNLAHEKGQPLHPTEVPTKTTPTNPTEEEEEEPSRIDSSLAVTPRTAASGGQVEVLPAVGVVDAFDALRMPPFGSPAEQDLWTRIFESRNPGELLSQTLEKFFDEAKRRGVNLTGGDWYTLKRKIREYEFDRAWHKESIQERMSRESRESIAAFQQQYGAPLDPEKKEEIRSAIAESHETGRDVDKIMQERESAKRARLQ